ncbi:MAG: 8-oxo-dGTP diphosphatase MutT [Steroidobacteraceae bacterium]
MTVAPGLPLVHVVAGALLDDHGRVLIAQRPPGKHLAGGWEFPGGKLLAGEASLSGLTRELKEELGIVVLQAEYLTHCQHDYPDRRVLLELWLVPQFGGEPQSLDGQALRWVALQQLHSANMLPADKPLIDSLLSRLR